MMNLEDAYRKLPEYLDGGLLPFERDEIEKYINEIPQFREVLRISLMLETELRNQPWIEPSPRFSRNVVKKALAEVPPRVNYWDHAWERVRVGLSLSALAMILIIARHPIADWSMQVLGDAGVWLGSVTGLTIFALHPIIILGIIAPVVAGGLAGCILSGRCRFTS